MSFLSSGGGGGISYTSSGTTNYLPKYDGSGFVDSMASQPDTSTFRVRNVSAVGINVAGSAFYPTVTWVDSLGTGVSVQAYPQGSQIYATAICGITAGAATWVPLSINLASAQTANALNITSNGGSAGDLFHVKSSGFVNVVNNTVSIRDWGGTTTYGAIYFTQATPSTTNAALFGQNNATYVAGGGAAGSINLRINATDYATMNGTTFDIKAGTAARVPFTISLASAQTANALNITSNGGSAGDLLTIGSDGAVAIKGVAKTNYALTIDRSDNTGDTKGIYLVSGSGSNLSANRALYISAAAEDRGVTHSYESASSYVVAVDSSSYRLYTSGGVGGREVRFQPGQADRFIAPVYKDLTNNSTTSIYEVALPTLKGTGGVIKATIFSTDGTDVQSRSQVIRYSAVNKGGAYTTEIVVVSEQVSASTGTLTGTWSILNGTDKITLQFNGNSSLTPTTHRLHYTIETFSDQAITLL